MIKECNFKFNQDDNIICTKKFFQRMSNDGQSVNMIFLCDGENNCIDFITYKMLVGK